MRFAELQESAITRYMEMFNQLPDETVESGKNLIKTVVDTFKGNRERLTWALKWTRYNLAVKNGHTDIAAMYAEKDFDMADPKEVAFGDLRHWQHYLSLPIDGIRNYHYGNKMPRAVVLDFFRMEDEYKKRSDSLIKRRSTDEIIFTMGEYVWVNLHRSGCSEEAKVMGHCGNGEGRPDETILSLREIVRIDGEIYYRPCLTFILNEVHGTLGEMKGRGNSKPSKKYHPYIIALLSSYSPIKSLRGGGYLPENNFSLDDLTDAQRQKLFKARPEFAKPSLFGCRALYRGKPFWCAVFDESGTIHGTYTLWDAEQGDFHPDFYMTADHAELAGEDKFMWIGGHIEVASRYAHFIPVWEKDITFLDGDGKPV